MWEKILHHPSADTGRWLLVAAGALLLIAAVGLARARAIGASETATAGGIAVVAAGVFGVIVGGVYAALRPRFAITEDSGAATSAPHRPAAHSIGLEGMPRAVRSHAASRHGIQPRPLALHHAFPITPIPHGRAGSSLPSLVHAAHRSGLQHFGWDVYLLVVSVTLIWAAARWCIRGLGYVGGIGLLAFIVSVAAQITRLEAGRAPTTSVVGWPLVLIVIGILGLAAPTLYRRRT